MTDQKTEQLENRIEKLESTIEKMMPSRRDALKMGGAALVGGAAISGTASAGSNQVGTIGSQASPVDLESEDINNADTVTTDTMDSATVDNSGTVTTQDLVVNGTATGPFGGGAPVLESGDSITVESLPFETSDGTFKLLYSGSPVDVLGGVVTGTENLDYLYEFSDNTTVTKNGGGSSYTGANRSHGNDASGDAFEVDFMVPARDVIRIEVGQANFQNSFGAEVLLKD